MSDYKFGKNHPPHKRWPIAWYNPRVLLRSAREMMSTNDQLRNLDRREMYSPELRLIQVAEEQREGDFWWDFVSDFGDGGNATYTVTREMQKKSLPCKMHEDIKNQEGLPAEFPIGELLVLGGDLAYPGASVEEYQYRLTEMWVASNSSPRKETGSDELRPSLAIPQNHDWFDNISTFSRYFVDTRADDVGFKLMSAETEPDITPIGTRKLQKQSYFAARLPNNWVILGFDFALVGDLDRQQFAAFHRLFSTGQITPDDNLILLYPEPYWTRDLGDHAREGYPKRYQRLEAYILNLQCRIRLRIAGDIHHYARETARAGEHLNYDDMLIVSGSGGAFLHPTHTRIAKEIKVLNRDVEEGAMTEDLRERVRLGVDSQGICDSSSRRYTEKIFYPREEDSRGLLWKNIGSFFRSAANLKRQLRDCKTMRESFSTAWSAIRQGNIMFSLVLGLLLAFAMLTESIVPGFLIVGVFAGISYENKWQSAAVGALVGLLLALGMEFHPEVFVKAKFLPETMCMGVTGDQIWKAILLFYCVVVAGLVTGLYFSLCSLLGYLPNNAFSPLGYEGFKSFVRFRIDKAGNLHGYVWGTDNISRYWVSNPQGGHPVWIEADEDSNAEWEIKDTFVLNK